MSSSEPTFHYVCTPQEARELIGHHERFWVSNCGCREGATTPCSQSRTDVCLYFVDHPEPSGSGLHEITRDEVAAILVEARDKALVARPFRSEDRTGIDGVCFCCDDCCVYHTCDDEPCDDGAFVEQTDIDECTDCGTCVDVCYPGARTLEEDRLQLAHDRCWGCGLCVEACPSEAIQMVDAEPGRSPR